MLRKLLNGLLQYDADGSAFEDLLELMFQNAVSAGNDVHALVWSFIIAAVGAALVSSLFSGVI